MTALVEPAHPMLNRRTATLGILASTAGAMLTTCGEASASYGEVFANEGPWLNGMPLVAADLRGKVLLVNFWTYTCINSLRPLPYLRSWWDRYRDRGLVVIGVHAPEFSFEHELPRVRDAVGEHQIRYPIVIDNDFRIWRRFDNSAWPAFYLIDATGRIRHRRLGEGEYDQTERWIQQLLRDDRGSAISDPIAPAAGKAVEAAPDWRDLGSPETYVGYAKAANFTSEDRLRRDQLADYRTTTALPLNGWSLSGSWRIAAEFAEASEGAAIRFHFHARDLHLVMGPGLRSSARFRVRVDGLNPGVNHGADIDEQGVGVIREARLYQLVRQAGPVRDRVFEIEFLDGGPRAYCFTFG
jgi:thiol-disulfide isomerase/thioredoxin